MSDIDNDEGNEDKHIPEEQKLRPARKQVKQGEITKNEVTQTGKEYSKWNHFSST